MTLSKELGDMVFSSLDEGIPTTIHLTPLNNPVQVGPTITMDLQPIEEDGETIDPCITEVEKSRHQKRLAFLEDLKN